MESLNYWIGMVGIFAFAVTAVLAVSEKGVDFFGATILGVITAVGGGTLRDIIIDKPVFWSMDVTYIWVAIGASALAFWTESLFTRKEIYSLMLYLDGFGIALFAIQTTNDVWEMHFGWPIGPVIMGVITAIGGGLLRDVLAGRQTLLMGRQIYAIPVFLGCTIFVFLLEFLPAKYLLIGELGCITFIFTLRAAVIYWNLVVPNWLVTKSKET